MSEHVKIDKIVIEKRIYPREFPDTGKINEYKELIEDGVKFPLFQYLYDGRKGAI